MLGYDANEWERQEERWMRWENRVEKDVDRTKKVPLGPAVDKQELAR